MTIDYTSPFFFFCHNTTHKKWEKMKTNKKKGLKYFWSESTYKAQKPKRVASSEPKRTSTTLSAERGKGD